MKMLITCLYLCLFVHCENSIRPSKIPNDAPLRRIVDTLPSGDATSVLIVSGIMAANGDKLIRIDSLIKRTYRLQQAIPYKATGIFNVEILYNNDYLQKVAFDALIASDSDVVIHGFFEIQIPVWSGIKGIRIIKTANGKLLHEFKKYDIP